MPHQQRHHMQRNSRNRDRPPSGSNWSSRDNSADSTQNWRQPTNQTLDKEFENISNQISSLAMGGGGGRDEGGSMRIPGVIQLPLNRSRFGGGGGGRDTSNRGNNGSGNSQQGRNDSGRAAESISLSKFLATSPQWYQETSDAYRQIHDKRLIDNLVECDFTMHELVTNGSLIKEWDTFETYRRCVQQLLHQFILREIKFCLQHNVENHIWKVLYYNTVEMLKRQFMSPEVMEEETREFYKKKALEVLNEGLVFFERTVRFLEEEYKFSVRDYIGENALIVTKGLKFLGLALVSTQKMFLFLGDLARYRELINETQNFGISRQWYTKAQQIMPNNGRPYYQLGVLSVYSVSGRITQFFVRLVSGGMLLFSLQKRKVDAVYYYMRNLMSSNPITSAKENLATLFDEIRKKVRRERECVFGGGINLIRVVNELLLNLCFTRKRT